MIGLHSVSDCLCVCLVCLCVWMYARPPVGVKDGRSGLPPTGECTVCPRALAVPGGAAKHARMQQGRHPSVPAASLRFFPARGLQPSTPISMNALPFPAQGFVG